MERLAHSHRMGPIEGFVATRLTRADLLGSGLERRY